MTQEELKLPKDLLREKVYDLRDEAIAISQWMGLGPEYGPYIVQLLTPVGVHKTFLAIRQGSGFPPEYFEAAGTRPGHKKITNLGMEVGEDPDLDYPSAL